MATTVLMGVPTDVTLAAASAVETLTLPIGAHWLMLFAPNGGQLVDVFIVTKAGGTAAADGRLVTLATINAGGYPFNISPYGFVGLAGSAAGTVRAEIR